MLRRTLLLSLAHALPGAFLLASLALPAGAQKGGRTLPVFVDGQAQIVEGFRDPENWIQHDLFVETEFDSDGDGRLDRMHVDVTRPRQTETEGLQVPVVYNTSPYFSGTGTTEPTYMWNPEQELGDYPPLRNNAPPIPHQERRTILTPSMINDWVPRGFAVVHSSSPGTGKSQGCPTVGGANESLAPKAVIDWLCGRAKGYTDLEGDEEVEASWCSGKVGMTGTSYNGTLCLAAATTGVMGLEAIIPVAPGTSYYHYYRSNGLIRHPGGYMGEDIDVLYDFIHSGDPANREYCNDTIRDQLFMENFDRIDGDLNEFWESRDYLNQLDKVRAATLMSHAFNDWNVMAEHSVRIYAALNEKGVPVQAFFHQGGHGGPPPLSQMNRWFTRYLHDIDNGVEDDPRSWVVREGDRRTNPTAYPDYPHPDSEPVTLHLAAGGAKAGGLHLEHRAGQGTEQLIDDVSMEGAKLAAAPESENRLIYATPELTQPVHLSGTPRIKIRLAASKPATNLSIWVVSLPWTRTNDINSNIITRGWADPQNHRSLSRSRPLEPGKYYDLSFDLQPDDQVIPAGQKIGLMVFASDRDFTLWPEPGTELSIDLDATSLELPVVGGSAALQRATGDG